MKALVVWGGWEGHEPKEVGQVLARALKERGFDVQVENTLDAFVGLPEKRVDLVVPVWTMGSIEKEQLKGVLEAVRAGAGIAGVHGGMCDAFRTQTEWQLMTGGQWVAHPGGADVTYKVKLLDVDHPVLKGLSFKEFEVTSEQYYMHVDPANLVLATTDFGDVVMPVSWVRRYGEGRVFYCSVGHVAKDVRKPEVLELLTRGMLWAARSLE